MIDEGFVKSEAGLALGAGGLSALDPKTAALLQVGAAVTIGSSPVCLRWSVGRAAAGATGDEIADALGYDVAAALEELDQIVLRGSA